MTGLIARIVLSFGLFVFIAGCGGGDHHSGEAGHVDATLVVQNHSSIPIYYLYVSPSASASWGADWLGTRILDPGEVFHLNIIPCDTTYDLKAEYADHVTAATRYDVFFECSVGVNWTLFD